MLLFLSIWSFFLINGHFCCLPFPSNCSICCWTPDTPPFLFILTCGLCLIRHTLFSSTLVFNREQLSGLLYSRLSLSSVSVAGQPAGPKPTWVWPGLIPSYIPIFFHVLGQAIQTSSCGREKCIWFACWLMAQEPWADSCERHDSEDKPTVHASMKSDSPTERGQQWPSGGICACS